MNNNNNNRVVINSPTFALRRTFRYNNNSSNNNNNNNKNVAAWYNNTMMNAKKNNIPTNRRVFLIRDVTSNGKIRHVYDRDFLNGMVRAWEKGFEENMGNRRMLKSPITKVRFGKQDIKAYPPTAETRRAIRAAVSERREKNALRNAIRQFPNGLMASDLQYLLNLVDGGEIATKEQVQNLRLFLKIGGRNFMYRHFDAILANKMKPRHVELVRRAPEVIKVMEKADSDAIKYIHELTQREVEQLIKLERYANLIVAQDRVYTIVAPKVFKFSAFLNIHKKNIEKLKNTNVYNVLMKQ